MSLQALPARLEGWRSPAVEGNELKPSQNQSLEAIPWGGHLPVDAPRSGRRAVTPAASTSPHQGRSRARTRASAIPIFRGLAPGAASA